MCPFLSDNAMSSRHDMKRPYKIEEDRIICIGLEENESASVIVEALAAEGYNRTVLSVRYRIGTLKEAGKKYSTLEAFHFNKKWGDLGIGTGIGEKVIEYYQVIKKSKGNLHRIN